MLKILAKKFTRPGLFKGQLCHPTDKYWHLADNSIDFDNTDLVIYPLDIALFAFCTTKARFYSIMGE